LAATTPRTEVVAAPVDAQNRAMELTRFRNGGHMRTSTFRAGTFNGQQVRTDDGRLWQWDGVRWVYLGA
jgi:hypothetical protein